jgi:hypothetical protein
MLLDDHVAAGVEVIEFPEWPSCAATCVTGTPLWIWTLA